MAETATRDCRRKAWLAALAGGALVALMLLVLAHFGVLKALVLGAVVCVLLGIFLAWAFCWQGAEDGVPQAGHAMPPPARPEPHQAAENSANPLAAPAPERAAPAAPAPAAPPAPAAVPEPAALPEPAAVPEPAALPEPAAVPVSGRTTEPAPPAFVSVQPPGRAAAAPDAAASAAATGETPAPRKGRTAAGLDAALAKSRGEPPAPAPEMLGAPRGGRADDLKLINGIGPKLEALLNEVGVWHFDQIAAWKAKDIAHVDERLVGFHGRITRDEWVKQAKVLAAGGAATRGVQRGET